VATWRKRQTVLEQLYEANREDHRAFAFGCASEAKIFEEHADDLDAILATVGDPPQETNT
jgi:hypothetical protein